MQCNVNHRTKESQIISRVSHDNHKVWKDKLIRQRQSTRCLMYSQWDNCYTCCSSWHSIPVSDSWYATASYWDSLVTSQSTARRQHTIRIVHSPNTVDSPRPVYHDTHPACLQYSCSRTRSYWRAGTLALVVQVVDPTEFHKQTSYIVFMECFVSYASLRLTVIASFNIAVTIPV